MQDQRVTNPWGMLHLWHQAGGGLGLNSVALGQQIQDMRSLALLAGWGGLRMY